MAIPSNKEQLVNDIVVNYQRLMNELHQISIDDTTNKELQGHSKNTLISINNLVAYLVGWGQLVITWHEKKSKQLHVDFPATGYRWNELGQLAQKFYKDYEHLEFNALLNELDITTNQILNIIESKSNHELYVEPWYGQWTLGRMIQLNTASPFKNARSRIRKWKKFKQL